MSLFRISVCTACYLCSFILFVLAACTTRQPSLPVPAIVAGAPSAYHSAETYARQKRILTKQDSLQSFDATIDLSAEEEAANHKLIQLREAMMAHYDSIHFFPPSRYFFKSQDHIYRTELYHLLKKMPKGGIHHLHPNAGGNFHWLVDRALQEPHCYAYWQPDNDAYVKGQLRFFRKEDVPAGFYSLQSLNDSVTNFPDQLYKLLTFDVSMMEDSVDIWGEFDKCFKRINGFTTYQPVFEDLYTATFDSLAADGVQHVELRDFLGGSLYDLEHPEGSFPYDSIIHYFQQAAAKVRAGREPDFTFKLIYTNARSRSLEVIKADFVKAFEARKKYPDLIKAYDLVAEEDAGHSTEYFLEVWLMRDSLEQAYGIDMPLCLHDGESDWQHVSNVYDAVLLESRRIGHGFNLSFFPAAEARVKTQNICIEVSPLSNQILGYVRDLRIHPAHAWIKHGIQISISPDDPAIFDYTGVTPDYWSVVLAWELDLPALKKLSLNAIQYSFMNDAEKETATAAWQRKWDAFITYFNDYPLSNR